MLTFKEYILESIINAASKKQPLKNVAIRMANGKIEMHPPGKSGSSGGGGE